MIPENTDDGLVICGQCEAVLKYDDGGDMPKSCPGCGEIAEWKKWQDPNEIEEEKE